MAVFPPPFRLKPSVDRKSIERSSKRDKKKSSMGCFEQMSSPYQGISDLLQSLSMGCFDDHPIWRVSHRSETEARPWIQSSDANKWGSQMRYPRNV